MVDTNTPTVRAGEPTARVALGKEALLSVTDICEMTGLCPVTAAKLMKESGRCIQLHRRLYVLESSFFAYLHEMEVNEPCTL